MRLTFALCGVLFLMATAPLSAPSAELDRSPCGTTISNPLPTAMYNPCGHCPTSIIEVVPSRQSPVIRVRFVVNRTHVYVDRVAPYYIVATPPGVTPPVINRAAVIHVSGRVHLIYAFVYERNKIRPESGHEPRAVPHAHRLPLTSCPECSVSIAPL